MAQKKRPLNIVLAASECTPFAKTGGLADVMGALPVELAALGHTVSVILPLYTTMKPTPASLDHTPIELRIPIGTRTVNGSVFKHTGTSGVTFYFVRQDKYFDRKHLYGTPEGDYPDNAERFIFFSKAVIAVINALDTPVDILHCHDWQTGLVPALMRYGGSTSKNLTRAKTIFTIHNLAYQGLFWYYDLAMTGLPQEVFTPDGLEFYGNINFMKAGIVYSDAITTVSRKYSREIQTKEFGCGLEGVLASRKQDLYGIINGVDYTIWSPETDTFIAANYSVDDPQGKTACRNDLKKVFKLDIPDRLPVIGAISRLAAQKGFDLISDNIEKVLSNGAAFVLLGTGDRKYHTIFEEIGRKYPRRTGIKIAFDEKLAHKIEAGSDIFLMPSQYEPCGLNQMYSLRYGTIPVVRATGGLDDTITTYDTRTQKGNGFKFRAHKPQPLLKTIRKAVELFADRKHWRRIMKNAMSEDFSWASSATKYVSLYRNILKAQ